MPQRVFELQAQVYQLARGVHVFAKQRGQLCAQGHTGGARQRGQVDDELGFAFRRVGQRVAEYHAAFGVGITNLDVDALAGLDHVAGPVGIAGY